MSFVFCFLYSYLKLPFYTQTVHRIKIFVVWKIMWNVLYDIFFIYIYIYIYIYTNIWLQPIRRFYNAECQRQRGIQYRMWQKNGCIICLRLFYLVGSPSPEFHVACSNVVNICNWPRNHTIFLRKTASARLNICNRIAQFLFYSAGYCKRPLHGAW